MLQGIFLKHLAGCEMRLRRFFISGLTFNFFEDLLMAGFSREKEGEGVHDYFLQNTAAKRAF